MSATHTAAENGELTELGVAAAATAIRRGEITAESYASALLNQSRRQADIHSFVTIDEPAVLAAAIAADKARAAGSAAPLLGVPLGVKDSYQTRDLPTSLGLRSLKGFTPAADADVVTAIKDAGAIVFGKDNLVEMSYGVTGHNDEYGQVLNPYDRDHISGGSSSGSAASVAARIVPASFGGDTVGSIRIPAALNGVVGYKPTTGRWPRGGVAPTGTASTTRSARHTIRLRPQALPPTRRPGSGANNYPVAADDVHHALKPQLHDVWSAAVLPGSPGYLSDEDYAATLCAHRPELQRRLAAVFDRDGFDALIFPTTPAPAPSIADQWQFTVAGQQVEHLFLAKNTVPASGAGIPGVSLPAGLTRSGRAKHDTWQADAGTSLGQYGRAVCYCRILLDSGSLHADNSVEFPHLTSFSENRSVA